MRIGLIDVDGHGKKKKRGASVYPNLAMCKIAAWHKAQGDEVEWYDPLVTEPYDKVYMSKVFSFSPDYSYYINAKEVVKGGTGYDIHSCLPQEVDDMQPDLTIYPNVPEDVSYGFLTRGCPNKCAWCVVPRKEGVIHPYWDIERVANGRKKVVLMDNNILAAGDYARQQLQKIIDLKIHVDFNQALDARLVTDEFALLLAKVKWLGSRIRFGCDTTAQIAQCESAIDRLCAYGFRGEFFLYTMIGGKNGFRECYERIMHWWHILQHYRKTGYGYAVYAYAQPYRDPDRHQTIIPMWQKDMATWCNKKMLYYTIPFEEYSPRKGFVCKQYLEQLYY